MTVGEHGYAVSTTLLSILGNLLENKRAKLKFSSKKLFRLDSLPKWYFFKHQAEISFESMQFYLSHSHYTAHIPVVQFLNLSTESRSTQFEPT